MIVGEIFFFTTGYYSDYGITAKLRALKAFDLEQELRDFPTKKYRSQYPPHERESFNSIDFVAHLEAKGLVENAPLREYHLGDYGDKPTDLRPYHGDSNYPDATVVGFATCVQHKDCCDHPEIGARCLAQQAAETR